MGDDLIARKNPGAALAAFTAALALRPQDAKIHNKVGLANRLLGDTEAAIAAYTNAAALDPSSVVAHFNLGVLHNDRGQHEQAIASYSRALEINPRNVDALHHLANALEQLGKIEEALAANRKILSVVPADAKAHYRVARLLADAVPESEMKALKAAYEGSQTGSENRMNLAFSLGEALERQHSYQEAIGYFIEANSIHAAGLTYDIETDRSRFALIKASFGAGLFTRHRTAGHPDPTPIFIVGMPRSGTTLIEQILASHPRVNGAGELPAMSRLAADIDVTSAPSGAFAELGRRYVAEVRQHAPDAEFITDKLPHNFLRLGLIRLALPKAKIIHLRRDPADTCLSIFKARLNQGHRYATNLTDIGRYHNLYRDLMTHWQSVIPGAIYHLDYDHLVQNQETATRALLDYCGLAWDDACLNFHETTRQVKTGSIGQVHRPMYSTSVGLSRRYGEALAPLFAALAESPEDRH